MKNPKTVIAVLAGLAILLTVGALIFSETRKDSGEIVQIEMRPHQQVSPQPGPPPYLWEFERAEELWNRDHI